MRPPHFLIDPRCSLCRLSTRTLNCNRHWRSHSDSRKLRAVLLGPQTGAHCPVYLVPLTAARCWDGTRAPKLPYTEELLSTPQRRRQLAPRYVCHNVGLCLQTCLPSSQTPLRTGFLAPTFPLKNRDAHSCALSPSHAFLWAPYLTVGKAQAAQAFIPSATRDPLTLQRGPAWARGIGGHRLLFPMRSLASALTLPNASSSPFWISTREKVLELSNTCRWRWCCCRLACAGPLRCDRESACRMERCVSVGHYWGLLEARSLTYHGKFRGTATGTASAANSCKQLRITLAVRYGMLQPPKPPKAVRSTSRTRTSSGLCGLTTNVTRGGHNHHLGLIHPGFW